MDSIPYLKSKSSTILWLIKFASGICALYVLYFFLKALIPVFREFVSAAAISGEWLADEFQILSNNLGAAGQLPDGFAESLRSITSLDIFGMVSTAIVIIYLIASPVFSVLDAIGATLLRFKNSGAGLIEGTHAVHAAVNLVLVLDALVSIGMLAAHWNQYEEAFAIPFIILLGMAAVVWLLLFCYHKDIARAMKTVGKNIRSGKTVGKHTHLSGLSILAGVCWALTLVNLVMMDNKTADVWITAACVFCIMIKQFMVAACNREMKQFNRIKEVPCFNCEKQ